MGASTKEATKSSPTESNLTEDVTQRRLMVRRKSSAFDADALCLHLITLDGRAFFLPLRKGVDTSPPS